MSNVYLCPVCRPGGKTPVVSRVAYNAIDNGHMMPEEQFDENSQDSMSITSENDETCECRWAFEGVVAGSIA